eukprot:g5805.t1
MLPTPGVAPPAGSFPGASAKEDDFVILYGNAEHVWGLQLKKNAIFHCDFGSWEHNDIIGKPFGVLIRDRNPWAALEKKIASKKRAAAEQGAAASAGDGAALMSPAADEEGGNKSGSEQRAATIVATTPDEQGSTPAKKEEVISSAVSSKSAAPSPATRGKFLFLLPPSPDLVTASLPHRTQIIYHADISLILGLLDLKPGDRVVETGTGSGSLTTSLAASVFPHGKVFTFEYHEERWGKAKAEIALRKVSGCENTVCLWGDACYVDGGNAAGAENKGTSSSSTSSSRMMRSFAEGIRWAEEGDHENTAVDLPLEDEYKVDAVFLDLPQPWDAVENKNVLHVLKANGKLCTFSPCVEQVSRTCELLRKSNFHDVRTFESLAKPWGIAKNGLSMQLPMRGHTSYVTVATFGG